MQNKDVIFGAVIGHIVGDALGVPVEFVSRDRLASSPVDDMLEYGTHHQPKGTWSDDSSMMLCTLISITENRSLDFNDMMYRFSEWAKEGYMTPYGKAFGIGRTTLKSLGKFWRGEDAVNCGCASEKDNGNGSIMRILPVALYCILSKDNRAISDDTIDSIHTASALTHAHSRACLACGIYTFILNGLINEQGRSGILSGLAKAENYYGGHPEVSAFGRLFSNEFSELRSDEINSSGYITDTLEAAVWCLLRTHSYKECVLQAVNLGGDTDTIAAVAGALAGILYGYENIPQEWRAVIAKNDMITDACNDFCKIF